MNDALSRRIEEAGLNNLHTRRQLLYDGWLLFLSPGKAKRARSVNAHFGSSQPIGEKIARCERIYSDRGLPALFRITPFAQPPNLDDALAARGYAAFDPTLVQTLALERPPARTPGADVELDAPMLEAFIDAVGEMRASPASQRAAHLERVAHTPLDLQLLIARRDGKVVGAGMLSIDGDIAGLFDIVTADGSQGQGIGTAIVVELLRRAWERNVRTVFLQVAGDNAPALAIYRKLGFATRYRYHYRAPPDQCR
jgi:ribosomal protein S18 acetylase RimI-like enzyme